MKKTASRILILYCLCTWAFVLSFVSAVLAIEGQLNINIATLGELKSLPYIGKDRASAIIKYRQEKGRIENINELLQIADIGPKTLEAITPYVKLTGASTLAESKNDKELTAIPAVSGQFQTSTRIDTLPGEIRLLADNEYFDTLRHYIRRAEKNLDMALFLFKAAETPNNRPAEILDELIKARGRGVIVRVILEKSAYDEDLNKENQKTAKKLRDHNIAVQFESPATTTHTKLVVIDSRYTFIGSHNLTQAALRYNHELSLLVDSQNLAKEVLRYMETLR